MERCLELNGALRSDASTWRGTNVCVTLPLLEEAGPPSVARRHGLTCRKLPFAAGRRLAPEAKRLVSRKESWREEAAITLPVLQRSL